VKADAEAAAAAATPAPLAVYRTVQDWTLRQAMGTPQFYILASAYCVHLLSGVTVSSLSVAHLTERGVAAGVAAGMLSVEGLMATAARLGGGFIGDRIDPKWLLMFAVGSLGLGSLALSVADSTLLMFVYAIGTGVGFGLTALAVTILLLNYYGRKNNLEIFSTVCLAGAVSALGPLIGGSLRDLLGSFSPTFQLFGIVAAVVFVASLFMRPPQLKSEAEAPAARPAGLVNDPV
jgi:MFS family permease